MKTIRNFRDLHPYGIMALTGESCRVGRRMLCDLNDQGRKIICDLFGIVDQSYVKYRTFQSNWNSANGANASIMIPYSLLPELAAWCLIHDGCTDVIVSEDGVFGREPGEPNGPDSDWEFTHAKLEHFGREPVRVSVNKAHPGQGTRAEHAASGRTE